MLQKEKKKQIGNLNLTISIIILSLNNLNTPIKRNCQTRMKDLTLCC